MATSTGFQAAGLLLAVALMLLAGCQRDAVGDLWVSGLTLPPDAEVVEKSELEAPPGSAGSRKGAMQHLRFNSLQEWDAVKLHFITVLSAKGYTESSSREGMLQFSRDGGDYMVTVQDSRLLGSMDADAARYSLTITRMTP